MFLRESLQRCLRCEELTPHSRRRLALPRVVAALCLVAGAGCLFLDFGWKLLGGALLASAAFLLLRDREQFWGLRCERCRGKARVASRRTKPTLDGNTEINIF